MVPEHLLLVQIYKDSSLLGQISPHLWHWLEVEEILQPFVEVLLKQVSSCALLRNRGFPNWKTIQAGAPLSIFLSSSLGGSVQATALRPTPSCWAAKGRFAWPGTVLHLAGPSNRDH